MQIEQFKTVNEAAETEIVLKKSRFISHVKPAASEEAAARFVARIKEQHREATHNVSAWVIDDRHMRSSDDGEPSGTAGRPVLEVIQRSGLVQTVIVVTRYFGGILLGAGGLVRAYTQSAQEGITAAGIRVVQLYAVFSVTVDYTLSSQVKYFLEQQKVINLTAEYGEKVTFQACCIPSEFSMISNSLKEMSGGKVEPLSKGDCYI